MERSLHLLRNFRSDAFDWRFASGFAPKIAFFPGNGCLNRVERLRNALLA